MTEFINRIKKWLAPPVFPGDEDKNRLTRLINSIGLYFLLLMVISLVIFVPFFALHKEITAAIIIVMIALYLVSRRPLLLGRLEFSSAFIILSVWAVLQVVAVLSGGIQSQVMPAIMAVITLIGLLIRPRLGHLFVLFSLLIGLIEALMVGNGIDLPEFFINTPLTAWFWFSLATVFVFSMVHLVARNMREALALVRQENEARLRNEGVLQMRLELLKYASGHTNEELMQAALEKICRFAGSPVGFYHLVDWERQQLILQAWLTESCRVEIMGNQTPIAEAGIWAEAVRLGGPVIHNDIAGMPGRKGMPEGHVPILREMVVPTVENGRVMAVLGVGNKAADYTDEDLKFVAYLADVVWEIVRGKCIEEEVRELESRMRLLSDNLREAGLFVYSHDAAGERHFEYVSAGLEEFNGVKAADALKDASSLLSVILPEYQSRFSALEIYSRDTLSNFELEVQTRNARSGDMRWSLLRATPCRRPDGSTVWYGVQVDITERKRDERLLEDANRQLRDRLEEIQALQAELREQALRDPLTGLYNRRFLDETAEREISLAKREGKTLSVIMMDIDNFKEINDTCGHKMGDLFLVRIASLILSRTRSTDIACRYGGEEFVLLMPGATMEMALKRAEEIREMCAGMRLPFGNMDLGVTISTGIAGFPQHGESADELLVRADQALYRSKQDGRNMSTVWAEMVED